MQGSAIGDLPVGSAREREDLPREVLVLRRNPLLHALLAEPRLQAPDLPPDAFSFRQALPSWLPTNPYTDLSMVRTKFAAFSVFGF